MAENSKIEWTDHTFNPWIGCTAVSPACDHCYAESMMDTRLGRVEWGPHGERKRTSEGYWKAPHRWNRIAADQGVRFRVFCASLADVFDNHRSIEPQWRRDLWTMIEATPNLDWLLLTKRPQNVSKFVLNRWMEEGFPDNVWLGISVENQEEADRRIPVLLSLPVPTTFLSMEPLLGPVEIPRYVLLPRTVRGDWPIGHDTVARAGLHCVRRNTHGARSVLAENGTWLGIKPHECEDVDVSWIIAGGESGPHARPSNPQWFRDLRDQCQRADIPFLFKQWGEWVSVSEVEGRGEHFQFPDGCTVRRTGKKAAGRELDGRTWDEVPG